MKRLECIVSGSVQGVLFRAFAHQRARELGVSGFVRNVPDGTVEIVAEGAHESLKLFLENVRRGPPDAQVDQVSASWREATGEFRDFAVR